MSKISDEFYAAFTSHSGSCRTECACGKTFFHGDTFYSWEDGELQALRDDKSNVELEYAVGRLDIGGILIVPECDCEYQKQALKYQNFLLKCPNESLKFIHRILIERLEKVMPSAIETGILSKALKSPEAMEHAIIRRQKAMQDALAGKP